MNETLPARDTEAIKLSPDKQLLSLLLEERKRLKRAKIKQAEAIITHYFHRRDVLLLGHAATFSSDDIENRRDRLLALCETEVMRIEELFDNRINELSKKITKLRRKIRRLKKKQQIASKNT